MNDRQRDHIEFNLASLQHRMHALATDIQAAARYIEKTDEEMYGSIGMERVTEEAYEVRASLQAAEQAAKEYGF